jgi:hypothetical protein
MSLGYVKGRYWVPDDRFAKYAARESFKALLRAIRRADFTFECSFSYAAQVYTAEVITLERFKGSAQLYTIKHNNAFDPNPMAAIVQAIRKYERVSPLISACCLEIECELLAETVAAARQREDRLHRVLDDLNEALDLHVEYQLRETVPPETLAAITVPIPTAPDEDDDL